MAGRGGKHILYFSTRCRHCQAFLEELKPTPIFAEFAFFNCDPRPDRPPLPPWLKSVPTLVVAGSTSPLVGPSAVNNWLFERKMGGGEGRSAPTVDRGMELSAPVYSPDLSVRPSGGSGSSVAPAPVGAAGGAGAGAEPLAYHSSEMGSAKWSDAYSYIAAPEGTSDKIYNPIGRNFESLVSVVGGLLAGPAASGGGGSAPKKSPKEEALQRQLEAYTKARSLDVPGPASRK